MGSTIRVLHVDDEPSFADLTATYLERENERIDVVTETDVTAAIDRLEATGDAIDCIVSDYDMPDRSGLAFLDAVRDERDDLPFILFTGKGSEEIASEAISAGVTDYLQKGGTEQYPVLANRIRNAVEQYRNARAAERTERRLQELAEKSPDVLWMYSGEWDELIFVNSALEELFGVTAETLRERPREFLEAIHPDDRERTRRVLERLSGGEAAEIEYRVNEAEGYRRWAWVQARPIFDADGAVERIVGFTRDITDRKERERNLELFREAVESSSNAVYFTDENGRIEYVNPAFEETTGYTAGEAIGRNARLLRSGGHGPDLFEEPWETLSPNEIRRGESINETKAGDRYVVDQTIAPVTGESDELAHFVAIEVDVTDRNRTEEGVRERSPCSDALDDHDRVAASERNR